jgi:FkbM family methyltransferase
MSTVQICGERINLVDGQEHLYGYDHAVMSRHWHPAPGKVFVDAGFGPGTWTLVALAKGATVHCFDPKPYCHKLLEGQLRLNSFQQGPVMNLFGVWKESGWATFGVNSFVNEQPTTSLPVVSLDDYFAKLPPCKVDCINMDVEWAEREVVQGAWEVLSTHAPKLIIEVHDEKYVVDLCREIWACRKEYRISRDGEFLIAEVL